MASDLERLLRLWREPHARPPHRAAGHAAGHGRGDSRPVEARTTDILTLRDGRISDVCVVSDELALLLQLGAIRLASGPFESTCSTS
jgi:ketosteroid isomerase-like protein